jgi:hypothetical protein
VSKAKKISFKRTVLMAMAVLLPAAGFLYWTVNYGSDNLRRSVFEYLGGAGTLLYFGMAYLLVFIDRLPVWAISLIVVALLTFGAVLKRASQKKTTETADSASRADDSKR